MFRLLIGSILGGIAQFLVGFVFWGTPLNGFVIKVPGAAETAAVRTALAQNLSTTGTGTYAVPFPGTGEGTTLYGQGPVAMIHYNIHGFPALDTGVLVVGLVLSIVTALMMGLALYSIAGRVGPFEDRAKVVVLFSIATTLYLDIGLAVFNHYGGAYFAYLAVSHLLGLVAAGLIIARWFLPERAVRAGSETASPK